MPRFQAKVEHGEAKLGEKKVDILPPDPIGELGSGWEKVEKDRRSLPVVELKTDGSIGLLSPSTL